MQLPKIRSRYFARRQRGLRAGLLLMMAVAALIGVWALLAPRSFFQDFPGFGMSWVKKLPKYNEHLIRDVGGLQLGFALLFAWGAFTLDRKIIRVSLFAWLVFAVPHLIFHALHLDRMTTNEAFLQIVTLVVSVLVPLVLLVAAGRQDKWAVQNTARWSGGRR